MLETKPNSKQDSSLVKGKFQNDPLYIQFENLTSSTKILSKVSPISLMEIKDDKTIVLDLSQRICNIGHHVFLSISTVDPDLVEEVKDQEAAKDPLRNDKEPIKESNADFKIENFKGQGAGKSVPIPKEFSDALPPSAGSSDLSEEKKAALLNDLDKNLPFTFQATGKVISVESHGKKGNEHHKVAVSLIQVKKEQWAALSDYFTGKQSKIDQIFKSSKGAGATRAPSEPITAQDTAAFRKHVEKKKVLIADPSAVSRAEISKIFLELGVKLDHVMISENFSAAQQMILMEKPYIVVTEYDLGDGCGLELLQSPKEDGPDEMRDTIFVVVTSNSSQAAIARSVEESVDAYLVKPYTTSIFRNAIIQAGLNKINPPQYFAAIQNGKVFLTEGRYTEAEACFKSAAQSDPAPALAYYYLGQSKLAQDLPYDAEKNFEKGLEYNRIHYKCLSGLYELFMKERRHEDAYEVIRKISNYFPANPKRLGEVLKLAILIGRYEDIEKYYAVFANIEDRDPALVKYICAALVVCGKFYLSKKISHARAIELFMKAVSTGESNAKILREIVVALLDCNLIEEARSFLAAFTGQHSTSPEFFICQFLVDSKDDKKLPATVLEEARLLLKIGIREEKIFASVIEYALEKEELDLAEKAVRQACSVFPNRKEYFESWLNGTSKATKAAA